MERISFNLMQLIIEKNVGIDRFVYPNRDHFDSLNNTSLLYEDVYYEVECENNTDYLWLYLNYGKPSPRNDKVTNIETGKKKNNSRKTDEAELLDQLFALYSYKKNVLYLSSSKKKKIIERLLREQTKQNCLIKSFFKKPEEIITILKKVDKISFTHANNLFNQNSRERQALIDLTGTDAPETFTIEATYDTHNIMAFLRKLFSHRDQSVIQNLIICGRDESDIDIVYNLDSFSRRIEVPCQRSDKSGMLEPQSVKLSLIKLI